MFKIQQKYHQFNLTGNCTVLNAGQRGGFVRSILRGGVLAMALVVILLGGVPASAGAAYRMTTILGGLSVGTNAHIHGSFKVYGSSTTLSGRLTVNKHAYIQKNLTVKGRSYLANLSVSGNYATSNGNISTTNGTVSGKTVVASGDLTANNLNAINGLNVGAGKFTVDAAGNTFFGGSQSFAGAASLESNLDVWGPTWLNSSFEVAGRSWLYNDVYVGGATQLNDTLGVVGNGDFGGNLAVVGDYSTTSGNISSTNGVVSAKNITATNSFAAAAGHFRIAESTGNATIDGTLKVNSAAMLNDTLTVVGPTNLGSLDAGITSLVSLNTSGNLTVKGDADINYMIAENFKFGRVSSGVWTDAQDDTGAQRFYKDVSVPNMPDSAVVIITENGLSATSWSDASVVMLGGNQFRIYAYAPDVTKAQLLQFNWMATW